MTARKWITILAFLAGCAASNETSAIRFPDSLQADWRLETEAAIAPEVVPEAVTQLGLRQARRADYSGLEKLTVVVYEMTSQGGAFELVQKWRPEDGRLAFFVDTYFVVLESPALDHASLGALAQTLDEHWKQ